ncbi:MAG: DNA polymerase III subunit delta [Alphaproteobacteria bacterium]
MKLGYRDIEPFVKSPNPAAKVILTYGPDHGLMKERAKTMAQSVVADINDPFNAVTLTPEILAEDPARLSDEANAMSMMGGNRLIRVEGATDKLTTLIKEYLGSPNDNALIILESGELSPRSSLRKTCEAAKNAAAIPCYVEDERDLGRLIRETLQAANLNIEPDAAGWLASNIAGNRQKARSELEKLIIYKGNDTSPITIDDASAACGESGATALDEFIYATAGHNPEKALRSLNTLLEEGVAFIVMLRALQNHFRKLHLVKSLIAQGTNTDQAVKSLKPPIFFKQQGAFTAQANRWSLQGLNHVLSRLNDLESQCKQTGAPTETLCAQAILSISANKRAA